MSRPAPPVSLEGRFALLAAAALCAGALLAVLGYRFTAHAGLAFGGALLAGVPLAVLLARGFARPLQRFLGALQDGLASLRDADFSLSLARPRGLPEVAALAEAYNGLGGRMRDERQTLHQRELLLDTVIQATPLALVLTNDDGVVIYSNVAARRLFLGGRPLEGLGFDPLVESAPAPLREAIAGGRDTLFTMPVDGDTEILHLSLRRFLLNSRSHHLYLLKQLTRELNAQEVATWKKVIRVIAHELNNSLAPISSLAHSGRLLAGGTSADSGAGTGADAERDAGDAAARDPALVRAQLDRVFRTIEERASHLNSFIEGYARFAKLPRPRPAEVEWAAFLARVRDTVAFALEGRPPDAPGWFDPVQLEQVLINLLKNAHESGSPAAAVTLEVRRHDAAVELRVSDRGSGMTDTVLQQALLPFYSTKPTGTGLGLTLSREIVEAHGGRLTLAPRAEGGVTVSLWLPGPPGDA